MSLHEFPEIQPDASTTAIKRAEQLFTAVCMFAGSMTFLDDIDAEVQGSGLDRAVLSGDTAPIFDWLVSAFSFSGISDRVAENYAAKHGTATWAYFQRNVRGRCACPKLRSYWEYAHCGYDKTSGTCSEPDHIDLCPLPRLRLRNGRLNQSATSFYLFVRDIADGDLVGWIDRQLDSVPEGSAQDMALARQEALLGPLRHVYGLGDKLLSMALATLLIGLRRYRPIWGATGTSLIAVDSLVHAFLVRTGILQDLGRPHLYGPGCYQPNGCASILRALSARIDVRQFNPSYPADFPRFIQHAAWRYCAADGLDICNGNRIDDRRGCFDQYCRLGAKCSRKSAINSVKSVS